MIELRDVNVSFKSERQKRVFGSERQQILHHVSFSITNGSCLGVLGESGSGKSTLGRVICGLLQPDNGQLYVDNLPVYGSRKNKKYLQQFMSVVFQDYTTSTNPRFCVRDIIGEGLTMYERHQAKKVNRINEIKELLQLVGLEDHLMERYPHELSGGQLQRVCIARSIASRPKVILFDEAISSLDAHTQVQIMDLLKQLQNRLNLTYIFITHDLTSVTYMCDEVLFLYQGRVVENIKVEDIGRVKNEYARRLLNSVIDFETKERTYAAM